MKNRTDIYKTKLMKELMRQKAEASAEIDKMGLTEYVRRSSKRAAMMLKELKDKHGVVLKVVNRATRARKFVPDDAYWLGTNIFRLRRKKGLSDDELAKACGISARRMRDIQNAAPTINNLRLATLSAISSALGVETAKLFWHRKNAKFVEV